MHGSTKLKFNEDRKLTYEVPLCNQLEHWAVEQTDTGKGKLKRNKRHVVTAKVE